MRALVISDTHFGAWTGEDLLRHPEELALLAPHLDEVDEVIFLGDLFDLLFASIEDAVAAAGGLLDLLREKLQGRRLVFLAGNHDHHLIAEQAEAVRELELATGEPPERLGEQVAEQLWFRRLLERRLDGVQIELRYPTYTFGPVLCTHHHTHRRGLRVGDRPTHRVALHDCPAPARHRRPAERLPGAAARRSRRSWRRCPRTVCQGARERARRSAAPRTAVRVGSQPRGHSSRLPTRPCGRSRAPSRAGRPDRRRRWLRGGAGHPSQRPARPRARRL